MKINARRFIVTHDPDRNRILFPPKIGSSTVGYFCGAMERWKRHRYSDTVRLDFSAVKTAYPNGMLPIIMQVMDLRRQGVKILVTLPNDHNVSKLFLHNNWAHLLDRPAYKRSDLGSGRHLHARHFKDHKEVADITNDFMDVVIRRLIMPKDILTALEWSVYEICDNVINHSESKCGGVVQAVIYANEKSISYTVTDCGRGILSSLKEGFPTLKTSSEAISEAIKAGVTRNKEVGQGNGLAGSLRITTQSGGSFDIISGTGRVRTTSQSSQPLEEEKFRLYKGTSVSGQIALNSSFSIEKALEFGGINYTPSNIIDLKYEQDNVDELLLQMCNETIGVGTRASGREMRTIIKNFMVAKPNYPVYVDWSRVPVVSSSFADEFIGKLFADLGREKFHQTVKNVNMESLVQQLLDKAINQRLLQHHKRD